VARKNITDGPYAEKDLVAVTASLKRKTWPRRRSFPEAARSWSVAGWWKCGHHEDVAGGDGRPVEHLFRRESGRMVAALTRVFGFHNLALAEDVFRTRCAARSRCGNTTAMPDNPSAWLMTTAKNQAVDVFGGRERTARTFRARNHPACSNRSDFPSTIEAAFGACNSGRRAAHDVLMHRSATHGEAQVALILHHPVRFQCR